MINSYQNPDLEDDEERPFSMLRKPGKGNGSGAVIPWILGGIGLLILTAAIIVLIPKGEKQAESPLSANAATAQTDAEAHHEATQAPESSLSTATNSLEKRLAALEERLIALEKRNGRVTDSAMAGRVSALETRDRKNAEQLGTVIPRLDALDARLDGISKTAAVARVQQVVEAKPKTKAATRSYHEVSKGDTFYSIARKNDISLADLMKLNNMDSSSVLHPGDRIIVK